MEYTGPVQPGPTDDGGWRVDLSPIRTRETLGCWHHPTAEWGGMRVYFGRFTDRAGWWLKSTGEYRFGWVYLRLDLALRRLWWLAARHGIGWEEAALYYTPMGEPVYPDGPWWKAVFES